MGRECWEVTAGGGVPGGGVGIQTDGGQWTSSDLWRGTAIGHQPMWGSGGERTESWKREVKKQRDRPESEVLPAWIPTNNGRVSRGWREKGLKHGSDKCPGIQGQLQ